MRLILGSTCIDIEWAAAYNAMVKSRLVRGESERVIFDMDFGAVFWDHLETAYAPSLCVSKDKQQE